MHRKHLSQLLYGTALLTAIKVVPLVTLQLQLGKQELPSVTFRYSGILSSAVVSLVLTSLAMAPLLRTSKRMRKRQPRKYFLAMLPWILVCLTGFAMNLRLQLKAIFHVASGNRPQGLIFALVAYCAIFGLALELMLHWVVVYHLMTDAIITSFSNCRNLRRATLGLH
ncbi:uncharacterized protein LOC108098996 [Drosophila ficusphila]|uniref:uncharacterized protein LOC108098996 n=1 Tax=Drosophila ficusphila TaxID=30025 RepID=UPI0007E6325C|nr:uncharacterized protein LOC108098996 [Drosophila ficusphila]